MKSISNLLGLLLLILAVSCFFGGIPALIPAFTVLGVALITRKALEPLIIGCTVGFALLAKQGGSEVYFPEGKGLIFPLNMFDGMLTSIARDAHDHGLIWVILVSILYGAFVQLLSVSGGIRAVANFSQGHVKSKKQSLLMAYLLSFFFFLDDYLNALSVGNTMRPITDKFGVSRVKLALVMTMVCVPITVIFPISTWTIFYGTQLVALKGGLTDTTGTTITNPIQAFLEVIPYNFAAWLSLIFGAFIVIGLFPDFKSLQQQSTNEVALKDQEKSDRKVSTKPTHLSYFLLPVLVLIWCTIFPYPFDSQYWSNFSWSSQYVFGSIDALRGIITAVVFTYLYFLLFRIIKFKKISKHFVIGLETITFVLTVLGFTYLLKDVQNALGFNEFVVEGLKGVLWLNAVTLPVIVFVMVGWICWATGSAWGIYAILVPTSALLSQSLGANFWLTQGALVSGTVWGAASCFFSDNRVLTAQACKVEIMPYALAQFPYQLVIFCASTFLYLIAGVLL